jgi:hypothetical protein
MLNVYVTVNNTTMGTVTGNGDYAINATVAIEAIPNAGYYFVQWKDGNTTNPRTITITQDTIFTAIFDTIRYALALSVNDPLRGTVSGNGIYAVNSVATIEATSNTGYRFAFWSDGNIDSVRVITITQAISLIAIFGMEDMYYVYAVPNNPNMGSVTGSNDYQKRNGKPDPVFKREYAANSLATITAIPNTGYRFVGWGDGNIDNPREFTVTGDAIFKAIFDYATGIEDIETSTITIYPNPATDNITIVLPENVHRAIFTLYDMQGKVLIQQQINNQDAVSVNKLAAGIYIYNIKTEKENHTGKIIRK